jgi:ACS family hexuronate transporter-like MFS transporter
MIYRRPEEHPKVQAAELAHIQSDPSEPSTKIPWASLITLRQTWAFAIGKFLTDPIWWVYLFWLPKFLNSTYKLDITQIGLPLVVIYVVADVGSIGGGYLSSTLIKRGWTVNKARKLAMLICAISVVPIVSRRKLQIFGWRSA